MNDREFILALKSRCEKLQESCDEISNTNADNVIGTFSAVCQSTAYWAVVQMIDVYLEDNQNEQSSND